MAGSCHVHKLATIYKYIQKKTYRHQRYTAILSAALVGRLYINKGILFDISVIITLSQVNSLHCISFITACILILKHTQPLNIAYDG